MEIKNKSCTVFLPDEISDSVFYSDAPFTIFEISPFVDQLSFENIVREVRGLDEFDDVYKGNGEKKKFTINLSNVDKINDGAFKDFCSCILSRDFFSWFKKTHLPYFERKLIYTQIPNPNLLFKLVRRFFKLIPLPLGLYYTEVEYSSLVKGAFIPPHTDTSKKRLSFVFYLPLEQELSESEKIQLGTVFWKPKEEATPPMNRFGVSPLGGEERSRFYEDYEVLKVATYDVNKSACFIKSDNSWHSVEENTLDYDRRAIVINVYEL